MGEGTFSFNVKLKDSLCLPVFAAQAGSPGLGPHPWESGHLRNELNSWQWGLVKPDLEYRNHKNPSVGSGRSCLYRAARCVQSAWF